MTLQLGMLATGIVPHMQRVIREITSSAVLIARMDNVLPRYAQNVERALSQVHLIQRYITEYIKLNNSDMSGLLVPPMNWCEITYKDENTILLVLASHDYDPNDYIHDYDEFKDRMRK